MDHFDVKVSSFASVDGTDFSVKEAEPFCAIWWSHKFNGPAVRYEIAVSIKDCRIVWINGPYPAGIPDKIMFEHRLKLKLFDFEKIEADSGYGGNHIATPGQAKTSKARKQKSQIRGRHENVNGRLKFFQALKQTFRHNHLTQHKSVFMACAVLTEISFDHGEDLYKLDFDVNYD